MHQSFPEPPGQIAFDKIHLIFDGIISGDASRGLVPSYHFRIFNQGDVEVGHINFRVGDSDHVRICAGHIGYQILPEHRGNRYALQACKALAAFIGSLSKSALITCDPDNIPSIKTIERLGATFIDVVPIPPHDPHYARGSRLKRRYRWTPFIESGQ